MHMINDFLLNVVFTMFHTHVDMTGLWTHVKTQDRDTLIEQSISLLKHSNICWTQWWILQIPFSSLRGNRLLDMQLQYMAQPL